MQNKSFITFFVLIAVFSSGFANAGADYARVDQLLSQLTSKIPSSFKQVVIQHSRLAEAAGASLTPSIALIFSDPAVNTAILHQNPLAGLDLPNRLLVYTDQSNNAFVTATPSSFVAKRHEHINAEALKAFDNRLADISQDVSYAIKPLNLQSLSVGYGIVKHDSAYDFDTTYKRFKDEVIGNNSDTQWFGEIDYTADAAKLGVTLPRMKLLMFGAPAPGAKAMNDFKLLGLDAFCQKILLIEQNGKTALYTNDIVDLARLYYDDRHPSHRVINFRLGRAYSRITSD